METPEPLLLWKLLLLLTSINSPPSVDFLLDLDWADFELASALAVTRLVVVCFSSFITFGDLPEIFVDVLARGFAFGDILGDELF